MSTTATTTATTTAATAAPSMKKGHYGWTASSYFPIEGNSRQLKVTTIKSSRGYLQTSVQAVAVSGWSESFVMFGDFQKTVKLFPDVKRSTEKTIMDAHKQSLQVIEPVLQEAKEFYESEKGEELIALTELAKG